MLSLATFARRALRPFALAPARATPARSMATTELRMRLRAAEDERMQSQLVCLRLEAQLQESNAQLERAEDALRQARDDNARLERASRETVEERTVEAMKKFAESA